MKPAESRQAGRPLSALRKIVLPHALRAEARRARRILLLARIRSGVPA